MNPSDLHELKQLSLVAELARPLAHECNNFLNNLLLQLAITEKSFPESSRGDWANLRREGKKLANLFQQWQRERKQPSEGPTSIELNQLIQERVAETQAQSPTIELRVRPAHEPIRLKAFEGEVQRLITLLLRHALDMLQRNGIADSLLEIQLGKRGDRINLRLIYAGATGVKLWGDFDDIASSERNTLSLPALACQSMVERLDGHIGIEQGTNGCQVLAIDLPAAS